MYYDLKYNPILHYELMNSIHTLTNELEIVGYQLKVTTNKYEIKSLTKVYHDIFTELMNEHCKLDQITIYESL